MPADLLAAQADPSAPLVITSRLLLAIALGAGLGYNADRNRRPAGMRLYATVGLLGASMALLTTGTPPEQASLVLAGVLVSTGFSVGLICLGLILQQAPYSRPTPGLTAAASLALVSVIGLAAGRGLWLPAIVTGGLGFVLLKGGRFLRDRSRRHLDNPR